MAQDESTIADLRRKVDELETKIQELEDIKNPFEYIKEYVLPMIIENRTRTSSNGFEVAKLSVTVKDIEEKIAKLEAAINSSESAK